MRGAVRRAVPADVTRSARCASQLSPGRSATAPAIRGGTEARWPTSPERIPGGGAFGGRSPTAEVATWESLSPGDIRPTGVQDPHRGGGRTAGAQLRDCRWRWQSLLVARTRGAAADAPRVGVARHRGPGLRGAVRRAVPADVTALRSRRLAAEPRPFGGGGSVSEAVSAPFTDDQVASLNAYQAAGSGHPFTCGPDGCQAVAQAERDGWRCPRCGPAGCAGRTCSSPMVMVSPARLEPKGH